MLLLFQKQRSLMQYYEKWEVWVSPLQYSILGTQGSPTRKVHSFYCQLWFDWAQPGRTISANIRQTEKINNLGIMYYLLDLFFIFPWKQLNEIFIHSFTLTTIFNHKVMWYVWLCCGYVDVGGVDVGYLVGVAGEETETGALSEPGGRLEGSCVSPHRSSHLLSSNLALRHQTPPTPTELRWLYLLR